MFVRVSEPRMWELGKSRKHVSDDGAFFRLEDGDASRTSLTEKILHHSNRFF